LQKKLYERRNEAKVCQVCPFREGIEAQERAALDKEAK